MSCLKGKIFYAGGGVMIWGAIDDGKETGYV